MRLDLYEQGGYASGGITENGGNISGPLLLAGNPSQTLEAVPKQYVDAYFNSINANNFTGGTLSPARLPAMTGDIQTTESDNVFTLVDSGVTPGSYGKVTINAKGIVTSGSNLTDSDIPFGVDWSKIDSNTLPTTLSGYGILDGVSINGGTLTGFLTLSQTPTAGGHAATKQYVDSLVNSGGIAIGDILRKPYSVTPAGFLKCNGAEVDKTTYADLYAVLGDSFTQNSIPGSGKPWQQQYQINTTQTEKITLWQTESTFLYNALYYSTVVVTKNRVYLLGGWNGTYTNGVFTAPINADGSLGTWAVGTALPGTLAASQAIVTKNRVYLMGGTIGNAASNQVPTVYTAAINADGTLGTWITDTNLPAALSFSTSIVTKNRVYLLGGRDQSTWVSTVYTAPINTDGTLGAWATGTSIPAALGFSQAIVTKNRVYLIGGTDGSATYASVYTTIINADGTLGTWSASTSLPTQVSETQAVVVKNRIYLFGGWSTIAGYISTIHSAVINADGTLDSWTVDGNLPVALSESQAIVVKNKVYLLGGRISNGSRTDAIYSASINGGMNDYSAYYQDNELTNYMMPGSGKPWTQQYQINTTQSTDITGWAAGTSLPSSVGVGVVVATKNRIYFIGGDTGSPVSTVYTAPINIDGTLGTWTTGTALPGVMSRSQAIVTKNRVYLLGGYNGTYSTLVYTAPINSDGTLGTWATDTALPVGVAISQAIITKNRVYLLGGSTGNNVATSAVYTAPINADGTLGTWVAGVSLPSSIGWSQAVVTKNRVYLLGGYNGGSVLNSIITATINSDGYLGPWSEAGTLPTQNHWSCLFTSKNHIYMIAGHNGSNGINNVYHAPINADGTLGTWVTGSIIPFNLYGTSLVVTKNHIYMLGGMSSGSYTATVFTASINGDLNDYSPYYDGTIVPNDLATSSNKFLIPDLTADEPFGSYSYIKY